MASGAAVAVVLLPTDADGVVRIHHVQGPGCHRAKTSGIGPHEGHQAKEGLRQAEAGRYSELSTLLKQIGSTRRRKLRSPGVFLGDQRGALFSRLRRFQFVADHQARQLVEQIPDTGIEKSRGTRLQGPRAAGRCLQPARFPAWQGFECHRYVAKRTRPLRWKRLFLAPQGIAGHGSSSASTAGGGDGSRAGQRHSGFERRSPG